MEPQELGTDMAALIEIGAANEADIPVLGQLASKAFAEIPLDYIGYKAHRRGIESVKLFTNVAREDMADPASHIFRAQINRMVKSSDMVLLHLWTRKGKRRDQDHVARRASR